MLSHHENDEPDAGAVKHLVNEGPRRQKLAWPVASDERGTWRWAAACRDVDPELFFPVGTTGAAAEEIDRAKEVCAGCPVEAACLQYALATNQEFGVWGGHNEKERRILRREWLAISRF